MMKKLAILLSLCFALAAPAFAEAEAEAVSSGQEKRLLGTVTGLLQEEQDAKLFVADRENVSNTFLVPSVTPIKKQIDLEDIREGEYAAVIFEEENGQNHALSTSVGPPAKVEMEKEELLKFAPKPAAPKAPEVPQAPEAPPVPDQAAPPPDGAAPPGAGKDKDKEATGFSKEDAEAAKGKKKEKKGPLDDVLSEEGPLSAGGELPPSFVMGKIVSLEAQGESPRMMIQDEKGKEVAVTMGPHLQVLNRYLEIKELSKGDKVDVYYEEKEKAYLARSILVARSEKSY